MTTTETSAEAMGLGQAEGLTVAVGPNGHLALAGEMDIACLDTLRAAVGQALVDGAPAVTLDLARVSFIDTAAVSELLRSQLLAASGQQVIRIRNASVEVELVLEILDLRHILEEGHILDSGPDEGNDPTLAIGGPPASRPTAAMRVRRGSPRRRPRLWPG